jgi:hypothetical protein
MGGVGYHPGCGTGATAELKRTSFPQIYGNQEKVKRRTVVRLMSISGDLTILDVIDAVFVEKGHCKNGN